MWSLKSETIMPITTIIWHQLLKILQKIMPNHINFLNYCIWFLRFKYFNLLFNWNVLFLLFICIYLLFNYYIPLVFNLYLLFILWVLSLALLFILQDFFGCWLRTCTTISWLYSLEFLSTLLLFFLFRYTLICLRRIYRNWWGNCKFIPLFF